MVAPGRRVLSLLPAVWARLAVYLLPVKSDLPWWHEWVMQATEVRFIRGRIRFEAASGGAPFPSVVVVFDKSVAPIGPRWTSMDRPPRPPRAPSQPKPVPLLTKGDR